MLTQLRYFAKSEADNNTDGVDGKARVDLDVKPALSEIDFEHPFIEKIVAGYYDLATGKVTLV